MTLKQSYNLSGDIRDAGGSQKVMLHAAYDARAFHVTVEMIDEGYVAAHRQDVQEQVDEFMREAMQRAAGEMIAMPVAEEKAG